MTRQLNDNYQEEMAGAYGVEDGQRRHDGVDEVDTRETAGLVGNGQEGHKGAAEDAGGIVSGSLNRSQEGTVDSPRDEACNNPSPAVRRFANAIPDEESEEDGHGARRHVHQSSPLRLVAEILDERGRVRCDNAARDRQLIWS